MDRPQWYISDSSETHATRRRPNEHNHEEWMPPRDDVQVKTFRRSRTAKGSRPQWQPIPAWSWMLTAAVAVALTAFVITIWLLTIASHAAAGTARTGAQLDAVRTGLAAGAGAGAAVGLMLAFRRQHHQEISTVLTDLDSTERRITDLYTKAVEQLGSDKAPVRLGGLYALERLAQDNAAQRLTIVNVICAYLRMPFPATASSNKPISGSTVDSFSSTSSDTWEQEKQVRLTAQRILSDHLRDPNRSEYQASHVHFWSDVRLDLTGATLIDFDFNACMVKEARFAGATFDGGAEFNEATFHRDACFSGATFTGGAEFMQVAFNGDAVFENVNFNDGAAFGSASFNKADFLGAIFDRNAGFDAATFHSYANFAAVAFIGHAEFLQATFHGYADFGGAQFDGDTDFYAAGFNRTAAFRRTIFGGATRFDKATFRDSVQFVKAGFKSGADAVSFIGTCVLSPNNEYVWPAGWRLSRDINGGGIVVRAQDNGDS